MARERTLVILKPDAIERGLTAKIIEYFIRAGLESVTDKLILKATMVQLDRHLPGDKEWVTAMGERAIGRVENPAKQFGTTAPFAIGTKIRQGCINYYLSGPLYVVVLEGENAIQKVRNMLGSALPWQAEKGTIRGDLGDKIKPEDPHSIMATRNLVHASDSVEEAEREIAAWFTPDEIVPLN